MKMALVPHRVFGVDASAPVAASLSSEATLVRRLFAKRSAKLPNRLLIAGGLPTSPGCWEVSRISRGDHVADFLEEPLSSVWAALPVCFHILPLRPVPLVLWPQSDF